MFRDSLRLRIEVDPHDPFAVDVVRFKELFESLLVRSFGFGKHPATHLAGNYTKNFDTRGSQEPQHKVFQGLLGQTSRGVSGEVSCHITSW